MFLKRMLSIQENLKKVREKIFLAADGVGRDPDRITVLAATKTVDRERIEEAIRCGLTHFGENRVQEAQEKIPALSRYREQITWHFIGHLQTNKAQKAVELFGTIQSVDSFKLAERISHYAAPCQKTVAVLIQVNLSKEQSKSGVAEDELPRLITGVSQLRNLSIRGLMTLPPYFPNPEDGRPFFRRLRELAERVCAMRMENVLMTELSMGMSHDFPIAIQEGATIVRLGTAIFGERT